MSAEQRVHAAIGGLVIQLQAALAENEQLKARIAELEADPKKAKPRKRAHQGAS